MSKPEDTPSLVEAVARAMFEAETDQCQFGPPLPCDGQVADVRARFRRGASAAIAAITPRLRGPQAVEAAAGELARMVSSNPLRWQLWQSEARNALAAAVTTVLGSDTAGVERPVDDFGGVYAQVTDAEVRHARDAGNAQCVARPGEFDWLRTALEAFARGREQAAPGPCGKTHDGVSGQLWCHLRSGHAGWHTDACGASWGVTSEAGSEVPEVPPATDDTLAQWDRDRSPGGVLYRQVAWLTREVLRLGGAR